MTKICCTCKEEKDIEEYYFRKDINKYRNDCKECRNTASKKYIELNISIVKERKQKYYQEHRIEHYEKNKEYRKKFPEKKIEMDRIWREKNKEKILISAIKFREKNRENERIRSKVRRQNNPEYFKNYVKNRRNNDPAFKTLGNIQARIRMALKNNYKSERTINLIGCSINELKNYLNIDSFYNGKIKNIDHIIPCSIYDLSNPEEQKKCFNYRNLRLIDAKENFEKNDKLDMDLIKIYKIEDLLPNTLKGVAI